MKCEKCRKVITELPYKCKFCGIFFCNEHRLPESHNCKRLLKLKDRNQRRLSQGGKAIDFHEAKIREPTQREKFEKELERQRKLRPKNSFMTKLKRIFRK